MDIRALPVAQGLAWFKQAIDLGGRNPRAVFGAAMLLILALYAAAKLSFSASIVGEPVMSASWPSICGARR